MQTKWIKCFKYYSDMNFCPQPPLTKMPIHIYSTLEHNLMVDT